MGFYLQGILLLELLKTGTHDLRTYEISLLICSEQEYIFIISIA